MVCIYKIKVLYLHQKINLSIHFKNFRLMKNNELLKKIYRYLNPYPQNLCLSLRPNPAGSTNRDFNPYPRITGTIHGLSH